MFRLCSGEMVIAEAQSVLLFTPVTSQKTGKSGVLTVTNFRLSFKTSEEKPAEVFNHFVSVMVKFVDSYELYFFVS